MSIFIKYRAYIILMAVIHSGTLLAQEAARKDSIALLPGKMLEDLVVTGQFQPQSLRNSVYNVKVISPERIKMRGATDLAGVLNSELGIRFSTDNLLGETDTKIAGMGGSYVKVLLDGVPLADRDATKQSLTQVDINSIERIEIVEGPMSVIYGTDALAGVINIITKKEFKGGNNLAITAKIQEETVGGTYSPFTAEGIHHEHLGINWNNKHWRASAYSTRNNFGGFTGSADFPSKVFKPKRQLFSGGVLGYKNNRINAWYRLDYLNEELFAASPMSINTGRSFQQYFITNRFTHQVQADWIINARLAINSVASMQNYKRNTESYTHNYTDGTEIENKSPADLASGYWDVTPFQSWFLRSTAAWAISSKVSIQPGIDVKYDKTSGRRISGSPDISDVSLFASAEIKPVGVLTIRPGVRFTKNSVYAAPPVIPSINTKLILSKKMDLRIGYAYGFRAPILRELYFNFFDANHSIAGNPDLKAEKSDSYTVSLTWQNTSARGASITSSVTVFYNNYKNFIDLYSYADANGNIVYSYFNRDKNKTTGVTFNNTLLWKHLSANAGLSYTGYYNKYQEDKTLEGNRNRYAFTPEVTSNIAYRLQKLKASVGLYYKYTGVIPAYIINNNEIILSKRDAFHWADLTITRQFPRYIEIQGGIKNLFDVNNLQSNVAAGSSAHSTGTTTNYAYGRSYFLGIHFQWAHSYKK